ncbi:Flap endonuclease GEN 1 [Madurella mycetomatis]|uniref:Flap endonuclease GEN 1 n=1 Tax=Madurella mycetomatis TaxID=100816 RepID=A0A175WDD4_9PEZI|nr:Flap endonuclease GEN 1 [Madurella mycetomatis]
MGIKGIYKEIGPGERVSLCKLAINKLEETGRPFRLAIDFSIWQFQVQAARGGANPAIRTLFYRLVRLLGLAIHPIFVFDGPNKPTFKRNKRSGRGDGVAIAMAKRLIRLFGFAIHDAPGEAEAECALLEREGVVDAVLSEDVDTIMFGCRRTLRNWSAEGKGPKTPTHVSMYDAGAVASGSSGLDREGMVLVALMSGGDYLPEGVPGCGIKVACEAARAGFGRDLCRLKRADEDGLEAWKKRFLHELRTNESGFFRTRHKALEIPEGFPNIEILRYYTHPVVSRQATVDRLKREFPAKVLVDIVGLREFARETFDWTFRVGAVKFIRVLAPSLLVQKFLERHMSAEAQHDDLALKQEGEAALVRAISSKRRHFSTDTTPELRISFIPADIVNLDLSAEPEEEVEEFGRNGLALNSDDEFDGEAVDELDDEQPKTSSSKKPFDPLQPDLVWIPETVAKLGAPLTVEDWERDQRLRAQGKEQRAATKATRKTRARMADMPAGPLNKFVKVTKAVDDGAKKDSCLGLDSPPPCSLPLPPPTQAPPRARGRRSQKASATKQANKSTTEINPWTLSGSQVSPRVTKPSTASSQVLPKPGNAEKPILISSSPVAPASPPAPGASIACGQQMTPIRPKRLKESLATPLSRSPSQRRQTTLTLERSTGKEPMTAKSSLPAREVRPFKRVKSRGDDIAATTITQKSIKDYGRILRNTNSSKMNVKPTTSSEAQPIEIPSDDEEFPLSLSPPRRPSANPACLSRQGAFLTLANVGMMEDEDPFGPLPPQVPSSPRTPPWPADGASAAKQQQPQPKVRSLELSIDTITVTAAIATTTTTAATASTMAESSTTKFYIPRTSIGGLGYFEEVEVPRDEADFFMVDDNASTGNGASTSGETKGDSRTTNDTAGSGRRLELRLGSMSGLRRGQGRKAWRLSEVEVYDLTGED